MLLHGVQQRRDLDPGRGRLDGLRRRPGGMPHGVLLGHGRPLLRVHLHQGAGQPPRQLGKQILAVDVEQIRDPQQGERTSVGGLRGVRDTGTQRGRQPVGQLGMGPRGQRPGAQRGHRAAAEYRARQYLRGQRRRDGGGHLSVQPLQQGGERGRFVVVRRALAQPRDQRAQRGLGQRLPGGPPGRGRPGVGPQGDARRQRRHRQRPQSVPRVAEQIGPPRGPDPGAQLRPGVGDRLRRRQPRAVVHPVAVILGDPLRRRHRPHDLLPGLLRTAGVRREGQPVRLFARQHRAGERDPLGDVRAVVLHEHDLTGARVLCHRPQIGEERRQPGGPGRRERDQPVPAQQPGRFEPVDGPGPPVRGRAVRPTGGLPGRDGQRTVRQPCPRRQMQRVRVEVAPAPGVVRAGVDGATQQPPAVR